MQIALPWASALDVSYVASHGYNLLNAFNQPVDLNAPDFGAAFLPTESGSRRWRAPTPGGAALTTDLLRPFRGFGAINMQWPRSGTTSTRFRRRSTAASTRGAASGSTTR